MSPEPQKASEVLPEEGLGSLRGCLVEGNAEQRARERRIRRRALAISILLQSAVLTIFVLVPLFSKAERISLTIVTPIPPYSSYRNMAHNSGEQPQRHHNPQNICHVCVPPRIPPTIVMQDHHSTADDPPLDGLGQNIPGASEDLIPLSDLRQRGPAQENIERRIEPPRIVHITTLDPAMLIHRVEPVYPVLARQTHQEGRVEMRAIIGTDGRIQSLQVVSGGPLFLTSAREAVQQWRYKPTYLNGQAVEIDTFITVVYTLQH